MDMGLMNITAARFEEFILVFVRVSAIIISMPVVGNRAVPLRVKAGLSMIMTFIVAPMVVLPDMPGPALPLLVRMAGEAVIGFIIGISAQVVFAAVQLAGQLIGFQMGFAIVNVVDPISSAQVSVIAQFCFFMALLLFLAVDAHHVFFYGVVESFRVTPLMTFHMSGTLTEAIMLYAGTMFVAGFTIGAPVSVLLLLTSVGLGMVARTVPQINIFIVGFPLEIAVGLVAIGAALPFMGHFIAKAFADYGSVLEAMLLNM